MLRLVSSATVKCATDAVVLAVECWSAEVVEPFSHAEILASLVLWCACVIWRAASCRSPYSLGLRDTPLYQPLTCLALGVKLPSSRRKLSFAGMCDVKGEAPPCPRPEMVHDSAPLRQLQKWHFGGTGDGAYRCYANRSVRAHYSPQTDSQSCRVLIRPAKTVQSSKLI